MIKTSNKSFHNASFRDPSGFMFVEGSEIFRQVNFFGKDNYDYFMEYGLYNALVKDSLIVTHEEVNNFEKTDPVKYKILKPHKIPFISYPYEWSFSQLKDAALLTLEIQKKSLDFNMSLKDASVYNIQFIDNTPIFIDTLSFEKYEEGSPWVAYGQFCRHFLAPLTLMAFTDIRLNNLLVNYIDGIPLDLASKLIPKSTYLSFPVLSHIHFHAKSQKQYSDKKVSIKAGAISKFQTLSLIDNLESFIKKLEMKNYKTEWAMYYDFTNYSDDSFEHKKVIISDFIDKLNIKSLWDIGSNTGIFTRIPSSKGIKTLSMDIDPMAVETNYLNSKKNNDDNILPLLLDITNPSPGIGWGNKERNSLIERGPVDCIMALALIHHLAISNNLGFHLIAELFSNLCNHLIIEFVPKEDSQVQKLLFTRKDIFPNYNNEYFKEVFGSYFNIVEEIQVKDSSRVLYLMTKK